MNARQLLGLVLLTLMWGLNWPVMKLGLRDWSPLWFRAITMAGGALALLIYYRRQGIPVLPRGKAQWRSVVVLGLPNVMGWHGLSIIGVSLLPAGRAAILGFTMPVFTVLLAVLFYGERFTRRLALAVAAVLVAIALLLWNELNALAGNPAGIVWMQAAAFCWALGTVWMQRAKLTLAPETLVIWMLGLSSIAIGVLAASTEPAPSWDFSPAMWGVLLWSVLLNYGAAQVIWFAMARALPASTSAMSVTAVPIVGILSSIFIGEWPSWQDALAVVCVVVAISAVLLRRDHAL
ncbi:DMT family transporter [Castellaniella sp.]|uniref:DMT family transporter n=1 Tax=Castellaniella sp. TaxID=1955812 RepID=UPI002B001041|nr:DMT family transporter [Castellaniella sp.]